MKDLEDSKLNLKKYIFDENKNDINLLRDLEEKLKTEGEGFQADDDYLLTPQPVKEDPNSSSDKSKVVVQKSPEGDQLAKVVKLLVLEAEKVNIKDAKKIAQTALAEVETDDVTKHSRKKRSISKKANLHKVESDALSHILKEVYELQELIKTNHAHSTEDQSGSKYHIKTAKKDKDGESTSIESSLLDHVTTLLSRSAVDHLLGEEARSTPLNKVSVL